MRSFLIRSLRYLNGRTLSPFPAEAEQIMTPGLRRGNRLGLSGYGMTTLGVHFMLFVGQIPPAVLKLCCLHSAKRILFTRNCRQNTIDAFAHLAVTSKPSRGVRKSDEERRRRSSGSITRLRRSPSIGSGVCSSKATRSPPGETPGPNKRD